MVLSVFNGCPWRIRNRNITMSVRWAASRLFTQSFIQMQIKENIKAPRNCPFVQGIHRGPVNGQLRVKCFHLMTSSWYAGFATYFRISNSYVLHTHIMSVSGFRSDKTGTRRNNNIITTSNDVATSFWRNNDVIIRHMSAEIVALKSYSLADILYYLVFACWHITLCNYAELLEGVKCCSGLFCRVCI